MSKENLTADGIVLACVDVADCGCDDCAGPSHVQALLGRFNLIETPLPPIPMYLTCPKCNERHIDEGEFATKPHHTHSCQRCGLTWRPAVVATVGVEFLPGFKNEERP